MRIEGLIGISTSKSSIVSKTIRFFRKSYDPDPPTHAFVCFGTLAGEIIMGESTNPRIRLAPMSKYLKKGKYFELWEVSSLKKENIESGIKKMLPYVSKKYGYINLLGFVWVWLCNKLGFIVSNPFDGGLVCSSYVYQFLAYAGYNHINEYDKSTFAPDTLQNMFEEDKTCLRVAMSDYDKDTIIWFDARSA